ncbi:MAG: Asparagine synthetase, partial [Ramlibacter sp.]|nr:Asparagine synthetase [Ramlibacter sp.]
MCGIAGALATASGTEFRDLEHNVGAMVRAIRHRGPDDFGVHSEKQVALGHARLSIIDLSVAAHQPMLSLDGRLRVVFNGEIYNFKELRAELAGRGYVFRSHSDTEVILHGYHHWGRDVFARLRGMFAIAIWDDRHNQLILARDRLGKKPLFYAWHEGVLLFGSEIKAILAWPGFRREANLQAIHHYLSLQYVPGPLSAFQGISKLEQATCLTIGGEGQIDHHRYWQLPVPRDARVRPVAELREELVALLDESVRLRMISDVPIGAFL